ncbi:uncharacterized protein K452DRAFT_338578 [Aplosporella prunicola CBS 121167]|uniref:Uncharacterized protein n=1 Tax=Aplosporella prunicola CBS 121167 TaxID=1176127 RepID=A0A6A6B6A9_9PEZI|nr:uncharacterized protein K452DRAFT_338578 [Aplosporella prunicola CBS 121167]KAF2138507.1 hypothetical protein K452DRAFT_338578 [Aplosporella prunicola CBS 121167]
MITSLEYDLSRAQTPQQSSRCTSIAVEPPHTPSRIPESRQLIQHDIDIPCESKETEDDSIIFTDKFDALNIGEILPRKHENTNVGTAMHESRHNGLGSSSKTALSPAAEEKDSGTMMVFDHEMNEHKPRTRKRYGERERKQTATTRKHGACEYCRKHKRRVFVHVHLLPRNREWHHNSPQHEIDKDVTVKTWLTLSRRKMNTLSRGSILLDLKATSYNSNPMPPKDEGQLPNVRALTFDQSSASSLSYSEESSFTDVGPSHDDRYENYPVSLIPGSTTIRGTRIGRGSQLPKSNHMASTVPLPPSDVSLFPFPMPHHTDAQAEERIPKNSTPLMTGLPAPNGQVVLKPESCPPTPYSEHDNMHMRSRYGASHAPSIVNGRPFGFSSSQNDTYVTLTLPRAKDNMPWQTAQHPLEAFNQPMGSTQAHQSRQSLASDSRTQNRFNACFVNDNATPSGHEPKDFIEYAKARLAAQGVRQGRADSMKTLPVKNPPVFSVLAQSRQSRARGAAYHPLGGNGTAGFSKISWDISHGGNDDSAYEPSPIQYTRDWTEFDHWA